MISREVERRIDKIKTDEDIVKLYFDLFGDYPSSNADNCGHTYLMMYGTSL